MLATVATLLRVGTPVVVVVLAVRRARDRRRWRARLGVGPPAGRRRRIAAEDPEALVVLAAALARALRGGASVSGAVAEVGRGTEGRAVHGFEEMAGRVRTGVSVQDALAGWCAGRLDAGGRLLGAALLVATRTGAGAAAALDGVAAGLAAEWETVLEQRAVTAQARTSAAVLVALPPMAAVVLGVAGGGPGVWFTPLGAVAVLVGGFLEVLGVVWMRVLIRRALAGPR